MAEKGIFHRGVDTVFEAGANRIELVTSGGLIATGAAIESSPIPSPAKELLAVPTIAAGGIIGILGIGREWLDRNLAELRRLERATGTSPVEMTQSTPVSLPEGAPVNIP